MTSHTRTVRRAGPRVAGPAFSRRDFLRTGTVLAAGAALASGCRNPVELSVPFHERPEELVALGRPLRYATVLDRTPVLVTTREGRPILVTPHPDRPARRGLTVRTLAALMDLYDPDRAPGPLSLRRGAGPAAPLDWAAAGAEAVAGLRRGDAVLLTGPLSGPATRRALAELARATGLRHVTWDPLAADGTTQQAAFGDAPRPRPRLDLADLVVGFGAAFLDDPADGLEADFAIRRAPPGSGGGQASMSRFVQLEGRLSLTGAAADRRIRVRGSRLAAAAAGIAHELILVRGLGTMAGDATLKAALAPWTLAASAAAAGLEPGVLQELAGELAAARGRALVLAGGPASRAPSGPALELATILINQALGAEEAGLLEASLGEVATAGGPAALAALVEDMAAGRVGTLLLAGANPVYDAPAGLDFAGAMDRVGRVISLADRVDETAARADLLAPLAHPFECWGDADLPGGAVAVQQPVIRPLQDCHGLLDVLAAWGVAAGAEGPLADAVRAARPREDGVEVPPAGHHLLAATWGQEFLGVAPGQAGFGEAWAETLQAGWRQGPQPPARPRLPAPGSLALLGAPPGPPEGLELELFPHHALWDGRHANNGWLQEFQDPVTRQTWGGALSIAPRRFDAMGLRNGDLVTVSAGDASLTLPAYRHAGMHQDQVAVPLGFGRTACGAVGAGIGVNAFPLGRLEGGRIVAAGIPVTLARAEGSQPLAIAQGSDVLDRDRRQLLPVSTLSEYTEDPAAGTAQTPGGPSAWPAAPEPPVRWGMAVDLSRCNGCGKCTIACQAENNVPVVGEESIRRGREMCWIRIDRYYDAPRKEGRWGRDVWDAPLEVVEDPVTLFAPMLCQHCGNAPCETVCPFVATLRSADGLNQQIYNRCVGTRYCANNCPFKVRRYNWFEYSYERRSRLFGLLVPELKRHAVLNARGRMQMKNNPEVTVRSRGVMEKCTFCVQRIREARAENQRQGRPLDDLPEAAVVPACAEACPTGALVFGNLHDPRHRVHHLAKEPRAMRLLASVNVDPSISYLTKVRHDKPHA